MHGLSIENNDLSSDMRLITNEKHSQVSRFKGMNMDISVKGQVMSSRLSIENGDKVSRMLCSKI